jgi:hypothetical protein
MMLLLQHAAAFAAFDMRKDGHRNLSRRERQIMDILYQRGRATASQIHAALPEPLQSPAFDAAGGAGGGGDCVIASRIWPISSIPSARAALPSATSTEAFATAKPGARNSSV